MGFESTEDSVMLSDAPYNVDFIMFQISTQKIHKEQIKANFRLKIELK